MKVIRESSDWPAELRRGAVSIGNFDGVHLGHARLLEHLIRAARKVGGPAVVLTFDPHPVRLLRPAETPPPLTWTDRKEELLRGLGVDFLIAYPTDEKFLFLSAREFFDRFIVELLDALVIVEGENFFFGRDRTGNVELLGQFAQETGRRLELVPPLMLEGEQVSSSRVRRLIASGDVEAARRLLTRPYRLRGMVTHGAGRGVKLGFPTANVDAVDTVVPAAGVYAALADVEGTTWPAAVSIGPNPTFAEHKFKVEVHLIGFHGSLYGRALEVDFLGRLRDIQTFQGVEALKAQLERDVAAARQTAEAYR